MFSRFGDTPKTVARNNLSVIALLKDDHRNGLRMFPTRLSKIDENINK